MPFALALLAFFLSIWIVVPGPIVPPFVLTVAGNEFWLTLTFFAAIVMFIALRSRGHLRPAAIMTTLAALLCNPLPVRYEIRTPRCRRYSPHLPNGPARSQFAPVRP